jgi:hypothetical protein
VALQQEKALGRPLAAADAAAAHKALSAAAAAAGREIKPAHEQLMDAVVQGAAEFAPVCAVLGGVVANNIIRAVSHSGESWRQQQQQTLNVKCESTSRMMASCCCNLPLCHVQPRSCVQKLLRIRWRPTCVFPGTPSNASFLISSPVCPAPHCAGAPLKNLFYYSLFDGQQGLVEDLPPPNSGKAAAAAASSAQVAQAAPHEVLEID